MVLKVCSLGRSHQHPQGIYSEMQILRPLARLTESETWGLDPAICVIISPPGESDAG